jgi:hypothetical protein
MLYSLLAMAAPLGADGRWRRNSLPFTVRPGVLMSARGLKTGSGAQNLKVKRLSRPITHMLM